MHHSLLALFALTVFVVGCAERGAGSAPEGMASSPGPAVVKPAPDDWLGKWNGPEGTFLLLAGRNGKYEVTVRNLDGSRRFQGTAVGSGIEFERDGAKEVIRATSGAETGMKWLASKSNCLTVRVGEGYCRD